MNEADIPPGARLHLGCGGNRLPGYINVDMPPSGAQPRPDCDIVADFTMLSLPPGHVAEIRLHQVFEHFSFGRAAGLLGLFNRWLQTDGLLWVEVPDLTDLMLYYWRTGDLKAIRHLVGSQEAPWAVHCMLWDAPQMRRLLREFGFGEISVRRNRTWFRRTQRHWWCNLTAMARKKRELSPEETRQSARRFWDPYLINREIELTAWMEEFDRLLNDGRTVRAGGPTGG